MVVQDDRQLRPRRPVVLIECDHTPFGVITRPRIVRSPAILGAPDMRDQSRPCSSIDARLRVALPQRIEPAPVSGMEESAPAADLVSGFESE